MSARRVLIIGFYAGRGGIEMSTMNYYRNMDRSRIQYDFVNPYQDFYYKDEIKELGGRVHDIPNLFSNPLAHTAQLSRLIKNHEYDAVNIVMLSAINPLPVIVAKLSGAKKIIVHSHSSRVKGGLKRFAHVLLKPIVNILADYKWACSTAAGKWLFFGEYTTIHNSIDLARFKFNPENRQLIRNELGIDPGDTVIGSIGRLSIEKNQRMLIDTLNAAYKKTPDAKIKLVLVGSGDQETALKEHVASLKMNACVIFTGDRSDTEKLYSGMDTFALPSFFEGLPMVAVEAQASGLPIISSDTLTREMDFSNRIEFLDLNEVDRWVESFLKPRDRFESHESIRRSGYDINFEARRVENLYINYGVDNA